jgi:GDPmannose 4,6-dehydratase
MKKALITGITGQDGYYLSKLLLEKGYQVYGLVRRSSQFNTSRIDELISENHESENFKLFFSDMTDPTSISSLINSLMPDEIYNLAAQSHVAVSFVNPLYTSEVSSIGTISILEAIKNSRKDIKYYQASSSEMYGGEVEEELFENSEFNPKSPYAAAKLFSHNITKIYRESYGIFAVNGILFNHESPARGETFVTRKISRAVGRINQGTQTKLTLGNLNAKRDWGFAGDYVEGMYSMLQFDKPEDWVLATGESHSVSEFCHLAFSYFDLDWNNYVISNKKYERPNEVKFLLGDYSKAKKLLGWQPKTSFKELVEMMVESDNSLAKSEKLLIESGMLKPTWENSNSI